MRFVRLTAVVVVLAALTAPGGATASPRPAINGVPVAPAGVGVLASPNVELMASLPDVGMTGGRFAGGYFFATVSGSSFFEPNPNSGFRIFDISRPETPLPLGILPLPHAENEDVDISVSRKLALISFDTSTEGQIASVAVGKDGPQYVTGDKLYVVSWEDPRLPQLVGTLVLPKQFKFEGRDVSRGPGHIASCIQDCKRYAWITGAGNGSIFVVDLLDPSKPKIAKILSPSILKAAGPGGVWKGGSIHDVNIDQYGYAWLTGRGGTAMLDVRNPLQPKALKWIDRRQHERWDQFIHHNSLRVDRSTVLVTEEDWLQPGCGETEVGGYGGGEQGGFQTWWIDHRRNGEGTVKHMDQWLTELEQYAGGSAAATVVCSSHWFTVNRHRIVAVGWYNQGIRFLDVSNPKNIRQVGYWLGPATTASAAYFVPGRDDLVYTADYGRGLEVLKITGAGRTAPTVVAPIREEWLASSTAPASKITFEPHPEFGWVCPMVRRSGKIR